MAQILCFYEYEHDNKTLLPFKNICMSDFEAAASQLLSLIIALRFIHPVFRFKLAGARVEEADDAFAAVDGKGRPASRALQHGRSYQCSIFQSIPTGAAVAKSQSN